MKDKIARLTPPQKLMEITKQGKTKKTKTQKKHPDMNKSASFTLV